MSRRAVRFALLAALGVLVIVVLRDLSCERIGRSVDREQGIRDAALDAGIAEARRAGDLLRQVERNHRDMLLLAERPAWRRAR